MYLAWSPPCVAAGPCMPPKPAPRVREGCAGQANLAKGETEAAMGMPRPARTLLEGDPTDLPAPWKFAAPGVLSAGLALTGFGPGLGWWMLASPKTLLGSTLLPAALPCAGTKASPRDRHLPRTPSSGSAARPGCWGPPCNVGAEPSVAPSPYLGHARRKFAGWIPVGR